MTSLNDLYMATIANGGNTINSSMQTPNKGYMVAVNTAQPHLIQKAGLTRYQFKKAVKRLAKNGNNCAGFWLNPADGMWYIEPSQHFTVKREAVKVGKQRKQIAIFNLSNFEEITL